MSPSAPASGRLHRVRLALAATLVAACAGLAAPAHAAIFGDDEARKAILDLRARFDQLEAQQKKAQADQAAQFNDQINALKRSILELNSQLELQRADNAKLRGQNEQLARDLAEVQRKQSDMQAGVEDRMRKFEPQKVTLDDKEFVAEPDEKRMYDDSLAAVRRNYKDAITAFRQLVTTSPQSPRAPEALLAIANCQAELKDPKAAKKTIEELVKTYPKSEAAQAGRERLVSLK